MSNKSCNEIEQPQLPQLKPEAFQSHTKRMASFREAIMEHMKNKQSLNNTQISSIQDRLTHIVSQWNTPRHPPYAAMIQRALLELKQRGGCTEKSISEFIKREYDDLPWAHSSLLKHHLELLSKNGDIIATRGFRYSLCGAGSIKPGKKHQGKKWRCHSERRRTKRSKLAVVVRSESENEFQVIEDPTQIDQSSQVAGNPVSEAEEVRNGELESPKQYGTIATKPLQLPERGENDICSWSKDMTTHPPLLVVTDGRDNRVGIEQLQQEDCHLKIHDPCDRHALQMQGLNPNEDAIHDDLGPEMPPGFEFLGVEVSESQEFPLVISPPIATETNLLSEPTISPLPCVNEEQQIDALPIPLSEKLPKDDLLRPLQLMHENKEGRGREYGKMLEEKVYVLALPHAQKESSLPRDLPVQNKRSRRHLKSCKTSHMVKVSSSSANSRRRPDKDITTDVGKSLVLKKLTSEFTIITRRKAKFNSLARQSGAQQDEGCDSEGVCRSTRLSALTQMDEDTPLVKYKRRGRHPKSKTTDSTLQDGIQNQQAEELPKLLCYHTPQEKALEPSLSKGNFKCPDQKNLSETEHQLEPSKLRRGGRPLNKKVVVKQREDDQSSTRSKLKKSYNCRRKKPQKR